MLTNIGLERIEFLLENYNGLLHNLIGKLTKRELINGLGSFIKVLTGNLNDNDLIELKYNKFQ